MWVDGVQGNAEGDKITEGSRGGGNDGSQSGESKGRGKGGKQKSKSTGRQGVSRKWKRIVLEVSKRRPLGEANVELSGAGNGKRKLEEGEGEGAVGRVGKENWKKVRFGTESSECMDLSEGLEPTLQGAPRFSCRLWCETVEVRRAP